MFVQCQSRKNQRTAAVITATTTLTLSTYGAFIDQGALFVCYNVASRTQGSITTTFQGSISPTSTPDASATWDELPASLGSTLNANGLTSVSFAGVQVPKRLRVTLTYASSFDGTLEIWTQTQNTATT